MHEGRGREEVTLVYLLALECEQEWRVTKPVPESELALSCLYIPDLQSEVIRSTNHLLIICLLSHVCMLEIITLKASLM